MRSIGGRGGEGAVVCDCFGEEKGAEEEEEGFCSAEVELVVILISFEIRRGHDLRFPGNHC